MWCEGAFVVVVVHRLVVVGVLCVNLCVWSPGRVVHGLSVAMLSLLVVFCGGQRFPFVRVA